MKMLSFDTTTELCSVALMINHDIYYRKIMAPKNHAVKILPMINQLLIEAGITLKSLDCIIFNRGPGSFVGVRVGISTAQGLALGADLPLVEVSSLAVLAQGAWRIFSAKQVITIIDARMDELYWARYYRVNDDSCWICNDAESIVKADVIAEKLMHFCYCSSNTVALRDIWALVGTGWNNYSVLTHIKMSNFIVLKKSIMFPEARDMFPLGICSWNRKELLSPNQIRPIYLRNNICG